MKSFKLLILLLLIVGQILVITGCKTKQTDPSINPQIDIDINIDEKALSDSILVNIPTIEEPKEIGKYICDCYSCRSMNSTRPETVIYHEHYVKVIFQGFFETEDGIIARIEIINNSATNDIVLDINNITINDYVIESYRLYSYEIPIGKKLMTGISLSEDHIFYSDIKYPLNIEFTISILYERSGRVTQSNPITLFLVR